MGSYIDHRRRIGEVHGIYTIVDILNKKDKYGHVIYKGVCNVCGNIKCAPYSHFTGRYLATICNHLRCDGLPYKKRVSWKNKSLMQIFQGMKRRCYSPSNKDYDRYGARGIKICNEWLDNPKLFEDWSIKNGFEVGLTIDRIDCNKNYCPENCRWVTVKDNAKYKSTTSLINVDGEIHTGRDWSTILGFGVNTINKYIRTYGLDNTIEFIKRYQKDPNKKRKSKESYYSVYMPCV